MLRGCFGKLRQLLHRFTGLSTAPHAFNSKERPAEQFPVYPPPPPQDILSDLASYAEKLSLIRFAAPKGEMSDCSMYAMYRLYEWFLLDLVTEYRNELEHFWRQKEWTIREIPDPKDPDPARYAFLAGVTHLLVTSFNRKINYGASRSAPAIMTNEYIAMLKAIPKEERPWEEMPQWALDVPPVDRPLSVPTHDGEMLSGLDDERANEFFKAKNIILWTPHIHFT